MPTAVHAETRCSGARPFVQIQLSGESWTAEQRERVIADVGRGLAPQGIDVCSEATSGGSRPIASLNIERSAANKANVEILLQDSVTQKRVARELDLERIPEDGRELAVAIEADELLRASWAEVALDTERARRSAPRPEVVESVARVLTPKPRRNSVGFEARLAGEHFVDADLLGAEAAVHLPLAAVASLELSAGGRFSPARRAPHGDVSAIGSGGGARLLFRIVGGDAASLHVGAGLSLARLEFRGDASSGARADTYADWLLVARASVLGRLALSRGLGVTAGLGAGGALRGVEATDAGRVVAAARGLELGATLGLEAR